MKENILFAGPMNGGKTKKIKNLVKELINKNESMLIVDPKEEYSDLFKNTDYEVNIINFREPNSGVTFNPFLIAEEEYKNGNVDAAIDVIRSIFSNIFIVSDSVDPFWDNSAKDYLSGVAMYLLENDRELNFKEIGILLKEDEAAPVLKEYISKVDVLDPVSVLAGTVIYAPVETRESILSVARQKLGVILARPNLLNMLSVNNKIELKDKKQVIIIINYDETNFISNITNIVITQIINILYKLKINYTLVLDNYHSLNDLDLNTIFASCNSRNISAIVGSRSVEKIKKENFTEIN